MKRYSRALGAILSLAILAACSGGGGSAGAPSSGVLPSAASAASAANPGRRHRKHQGWIKTRVHVPANKKHRRHGKNGHWLPAATTEIDFSLMAVNGNTDDASWCNVGQGQGCYNFQIYTTGSGSQGCVSDGNGGLECSVNEPAPAAADTYQIQAQYCAGKLNADGTCAAPDGLQLLSQSTSIINVPLNGTAIGSFTLNPVVASLQWAASNVQVGSGQPFATGAQAPYAALQIQALDEYGDVIIGATTDPAGSFNTALYLQWSGDPDYIVWNCTDPSVQFETGGGPYSDLPGFKPLSLETIANGYAPDSWDGRHKGAGKRGHWYESGFNSPETAPKTEGTDGNGNPVQAIGNNGVEINYDGSSPLDLYTEFDCNAYDDEGNQATLAVTLGNGTITWGGNSRHTGHPVHH
jgi:hypothetical protein